MPTSARRDSPFFEPDCGEFGHRARADVGIGPYGGANVNDHLYEEFEI